MTPLATSRPLPPDPRAPEPASDATVWHQGGPRLGHHGATWRDCAACRLLHRADGTRRAA